MKGQRHRRRVNGAQSPRGEPGQRQFVGRRRRGRVDAEAAQAQGHKFEGEERPHEQAGAAEQQILRDHLDRHAPVDVDAAEEFFEHAAGGEHAEREHRHEQDEGEHAQVVALPQPHEHKAEQQPHAHPSGAEEHGILAHEHMPHRVGGAHERGAHGRGGRAEVGHAPHEHGLAALGRQGERDPPRTRARGHAARVGVAGLGEQAHHPAGARQVQAVRHAGLFDEPVERRAALWQPDAQAVPRSAFGRQSLLRKRAAEGHGVPPAPFLHPEHVGRRAGVVGAGQPAAGQAQPGRVVGEAAQVHDARHRHRRHRHIRAAAAEEHGAEREHRPQEHLGAREAGPQRTRLYGTVRRGHKRAGRG